MQSTPFKVVHMNARTTRLAMRQLSDYQKHCMRNTHRRQQNRHRDFAIG